MRRSQLPTPDSRTTVKRFTPNPGTRDSGLGRFPYFAHAYYFVNLD